MHSQAEWWLLQSTQNIGRVAEDMLEVDLRACITVISLWLKQLGAAKSWNQQYTSAQVAQRTTAHGHTSSESWKGIA